MCIGGGLNPQNVSTHSRPKAAGFIRPDQLGTEEVSTHSRPKAAGMAAIIPTMAKIVSTHSRPKAAGKDLIGLSNTSAPVSTHSRPKAAGCFQLGHIVRYFSFNSQPPEGGWRRKPYKRRLSKMFQLTAARRRLEGALESEGWEYDVSTHSRPKAAGPNI